MKWFVSDTHWGHENVIKYSNRPFANKQEMNRALIKNWNDRVNPGDEVYHLGDVFFMNADEAMRTLNQLNGQITLIYGNHDQVIKKNRELREMFHRTLDYLELSIPDDDASRGSQKIVLSHFPMITWNKAHHGAFMLHGHCHGNLRYPFKGRILDVGVDVHNFAPISYDEIKAHMKPIVPEFLDHHSED